MKNRLSFVRRIVAIGLLVASPTFLACGNSDAPPGSSAGSSGTGGAKPGDGGNPAAAGHSARGGFGGSMQGGASQAGAAHGGSAAGSVGGSSAGTSSVAGSAGDGGSPNVAGSSNAGAGGENSGTGGSHAGGHAGSSSAGGHAGNTGPGPTMSATQAIFDQHCINCHDAAKTGLSDYPALPLTSDAAYGALVSHPADQSCGGTRVVPADSAHSYLFQKVSDPTPCSGLQMPHKPEVGPNAPLNATEIETIRAWIDGGAQR